MKEGAKFRLPGLNGENDWKLFLKPSTQLRLIAKGRLVRAQLAYLEQIPGLRKGAGFCAHARILE
ncbi:MAG: hypothetical protein IVW51_01385 [Thermaceae bacterium]|nr:hypothetical protein [Thermaceae bacterium]